MRSVNAFFLLAMFLAAVFFGAFDWAVFDAFSNHHNGADASSYIVIQAFIELVGLAFSIFTGWILYQVEQEQKEVAETVARNDMEAFLVVARHRMSPTLYVFEACGAFLLIVGFHLFHIDRRAVSIFIVGGSGFLISLLFVYLVDLDNPLTGAVNVRVPRGWKQKLAQHEGSRFEE
jgi:hypothetical protein